MRLKVNKFTFLDSLNFLPMALSKLPSAFDLPPASKKGYFCHKFNIPEHANYIGPMPPISSYGPENMSDSGRKKFDNWYNENKDGVFDISKEILEYCVLDVTISRQACLRFRALFLAESGVCPFREATTIASACLGLYRRKRFKRQTIGKIPRGGYRMRDRQSKVALEWLTYLEHEQGIQIQHAGNGIERRLTNAGVDGFCEATNTVYQFHGCFYHGCPKCFRKERCRGIFHTDRMESFEQRNKKTLRKDDSLRQQGYTVVTMWGCAFDRLRKDNRDIDAWLEQNPVPLKGGFNPRDAFFGSRTNYTVRGRRGGWSDQVPRYQFIVPVYL